MVFLANAALLVLQLVAGRLLAPFIGCSLATWTSIIGVFLAGISLGNWHGGQLADRAPHERTLRWLLAAGAAAMLATLGIIALLGDGSLLRPIALHPRILLLTLLTCFPPAYILSLITPVVIKLLLPDVAHTGRVAGLVYALGTLGSLVGNFLTGFVLLAQFTTFTIVLGCVGLLLLAALAVSGTGASGALGGAASARPSATPGERPALGSLSLLAACVIVFIASFCSMSLEIAASRLLAPHLGVSLYSWTGIIGVVLLGVMAGNFAGGRLADRWPSRETLGSTLFFAGLCTLLVLLILGPLSNSVWVSELGIIPRILLWTAVLFVAPMFLLGTISPQVTRLAVVDWDHAGRTAGRVYAWSCVGAIAGTFATGWGGIPLLGGVNGVVLAISVVLVLLAFATGRFHERRAELFLGSIVLGAGIFGLFYKGKLISKYDLETNYYAIYTYDAQDDSGSDTDDQERITRKLALDLLAHSYVKGWIRPDGQGGERFEADPTYMGYEHEEVQAEFARLASRQTQGAPRILVIGGGGYTFPRWAQHALPRSTIEVVEIDPGVTEIAHRKLGLPRDTPIISHHLDGRQFVQEQAVPGSYQLVIQDAVNDLSVPYHILTREYFSGVRKLLAPGGVFLLTVIDEFEDGMLMRAAVRTMREAFPHVELLAASALWQPVPGHTVGRQVWVIYGSEQPLDREALMTAVKEQTGGAGKTEVMPAAELEAYLAGKPAPVLRDVYAPVDNLISIAFRKRDVRR